MRNPSRPWHSISADEAAFALETSERGLDERDAAARLARDGYNEIEAEREDPWWRILLRQFQDPLIYILLVAAVATVALRDYADTGVIIFCVLLNTVIGFVQEMRARQAMRALASLNAPHAEVIREGKPRDIESRGLVVGDVVNLASGARLPADVRLTKVQGLEVDESLLTGESATVRKQTDRLERGSLVAGDQSNMAFAGTTVSRGRGRGIVVRTASDTELGRIALTMREVGHTTTPLQRKIKRFGKQIGLVVLGLTALIIAIGLVRRMPTGEILLTAVAMAVSVIPEGLLVILTVTLAVGVRRMARRNAIIRSLPAVETLGSTTVIGSDKTGTLTANAMTVVAVWAGGREYEVSGAGYSTEGVVARDGRPVTARDDRSIGHTLTTASLANEADARFAEGDRMIGDPMEIALHVAAVKAGLDPIALRAQHREHDVLPFEPERRFMASVNEHDGSRVLHLKGAPEAIVAMCDRMMTDDGLSPLDPDQIHAAASAMADRGLRVLATAERDAGNVRLSGLVDREMPDRCVFTGLLGMEDPPRPEAREAIRAAHDAGIRVMMLTGDHVDTARAIGGQLGLRAEAGALSGQDLERLSDEELDLRLGNVDIYARVAPEHKLRIVQRLKARNEIVAVTGDGVNDAPALRAAHLGIAMGKSGTDVAREASDMVLADDNFATITAAVEEGRIVFANVRKVTFFLLSTAVGEVIAILVALSAGWPIPYVAAQILWINLVTNGLQDIALAVEPGEPGLLKQPPRDEKEGVLSRRLLERLLAVGSVLAVGTLAVFWWSLRQTGDLDHARTLAMTQMVVFQFFHVFNCRSLNRSVFGIPLLSNRFLFVTLVGAALAHLAVLYVPTLQGIFRTSVLSLEEWGLILLVGSTVIVGGEVDKWWNRRRHTPMG